MTTAFIAGATGYTGQSVVAECRKRGWTTVAHVRPDSGRRDEWTTTFEQEGAQVDTSAWTADAMADAMQRHRPDVVFSLLGTTAKRAKADGSSYEAVDYGLSVLLLGAATTIDPAPCFVYLSAIGVYKNHLRLLQAYRRALDEEPELPELLIAGIPEEPDYLQRILAKIEELELEKKARYLGTVDRETIPAWLHHAEVNFFPSECETNSVVLAEILGVGGVLACSRCDPMPEVAGDAAELFDPHSVDEMADVMLRLHRQDERREELRQLARQRAAELSWDRCGEAIWKAAGTAKAAIERRRRGS